MASVMRGMMNGNTNEMADGATNRNDIGRENGPRHRRPVRWLVAGVLVVSVVAGLVVFDPLARLLDPTLEASEEGRDQVEVSISSLVGTVEVEGELAPIWSRVAPASASGTLTAVTSVSQEVDRATVLFEVDETPVVAMIGALPAWREMAVGTVGPDVAQLEANLVALGYDPEGEMTVDDSFTERTATVVERWQTDFGVAVTGVVPAGAVVFVPEPGEVTGVTLSVGESVGGSVGASTPSGGPVTVSALGREVRFEVPAEDADSIDLGTPIAARLPDRSVVDAVVTTLVPVADGRWAATATLVASESDPSDGELPAGEAVPLVVTWSQTLADDVTTVPARALTRLDSGAYAVEVVDGDRTRFVEVGIGARSGSTVEIISDLGPGTVVIAP